jgi:hypothetical protein
MVILLREPVGSSTDAESLVELYTLELDARAAHTEVAASLDEIAWSAISVVTQAFAAEL